MNIRKTAANILKATMQGKLLLSLKVDKVFLHIIYFFVIVWLCIYTNLKIEQTLARVEENSRTIEDLKIYHAQKTSELASFDRISTVQEMLAKQGSKLTLPDKPAAHIED